MLIAVDVGGTKITVSLVNKEKIIIKMLEKVKLKGDNNTIPRQINHMIVTVCKQIGVTSEEISAVGVSTCSPFARKGKHRVIAAPNLCGGLGLKQTEIPNDWIEIPLQSYLADKYPLVEIENDCVSAVVAEKKFGAGKNIKNIVYITWSTGIGCGAYIDGHLIKGKNGNAPHLGPIYMCDTQMGYGNEGFTHLEALASGTAIARNYGNGTSTKEIFDLYDKDEKAKQIIDRAIYHFVQGLVSVNCMFDTEVFILGGSVFFHNQNFLMPLIEKTFQDSSFPVFSNGVKIVASELGDSLGDMAALSLVMPEDWVKSWQKSQPWKDVPKTIEL